MLHTGNIQVGKFRHKINSKRRCGTWQEIEYQECKAWDERGRGDLRVIRLIHTGQAHQRQLSRGLMRESIRLVMLRGTGQERLVSEQLRGGSIEGWGRTRVRMIPRRTQHRRGSMRWRFPILVCLRLLPGPRCSRLRGHSPISSAAADRRADRLQRLRAASILIHC